jgi:hypothetical protein
MRDWIYRHTTSAGILVLLFYVSMIVLSLSHGTASTITVSLGSFLLAHLIWGTGWIEGQQEYPEYNPDKGE